MRIIPFAKPEHPHDPKAYLRTLKDVLSRYPHEKHASSHEKLSDIFERRIAELCGSVYSLAFQSTAIALKVSLSHAQVGKGHHVLCPSYMPIRYVNIILESGATPVFVDLVPDSYEMSFASASSKLTEKTKAVLLFYPYGIPCDPKSFQRLCKDNSLFLIEIVAGGLGSKYQNKSLGTYGDVGILEFHPKRSIYSGESGFLITDDAPLAEYSKKWLLSKLDVSDDPKLPRKRISEFHSAVGLWMLDRLSESFSRKLQVSKKYDALVKAVPGISSFSMQLKGDWNHHYYPIVVEGERRNKIADILTKRGIETQRGYSPAHTNTFIEALIRPPRLSNTERVVERTLLLPIYPSLAPEDQDYACETLQGAFQTYFYRSTMEASA